MATQSAELLVRYLQEHQLILTTAESCTAGGIIADISGVEGCGAVLECGYVVYSVSAKRRILNVSQSTIDRFNITSEEVAREMAEGALRDSDASVAIATTGVAGPEPKDGIAPGTVCLAWVFRMQGDLHAFTITRRFSGNREAVQAEASCYAMQELPGYHGKLLRRFANTED